MEIESPSAKQGQRIDRLLSINAAMQSLLMILQLIAPLIGFMTEENAASWRILLTIIPAALMLPFIYVRRPHALFMLIGAYIFILIVNYAFFPMSDTFILSGEALKLPLTSIVIILSVYSIKDFTVFKRTLIYLSRVTAFVGLIFGVMFIRNFALLDHTYSMSFSYALLLPILLLFTTTKWYDVTISLLCLLLVLLVGARGTLLISLIFYGIYMVFFSDARIKFSYVIIALVLIFIIQRYLPFLFSYEGSRTLRMMESGTITDDTGRLEIYSYIIDRIWERPLLGWGIGSDRGLLLAPGGRYSHNLLLEVFVEFGIFGGSALLLALLWKTIQKYRSLPNRESRLFFLMITCSCVFPLMVSSSYLINTGFALFIGVLCYQYPSIDDDEFDNSVSSVEVSTFNTD